jgi:hypothetical protein
MSTRVDRDKLGSQYLATIQSLSGELAGATAAIGRNDISALERHVEAQQDLCAQILGMLKLHPSLPEECCGLPPIISALRELRQNNRVYSALLTMSGRSHRVLMALCNSYRGSCNSVDHTPTSRKLSCEA